MGTVEENNANAPMAFALTAAAGMATCLGAAIVFSRRLVKLASKRFLAGSLGLAAGVMLYVSLVEIFVKSEDSFANHGHAEADAYLYATLSLFGGIIFYKGLDYGVHLLEGNAGEHDVDIDLYDLDEASLDGGAIGDAAPSDEVVKGESSAKAEAAPKVAPTGAGGSVLLNGEGKHAAGSQNASREFPRDHDVVVELSSGSAVFPSPDLHTLHLRVAGKVQQQHKEEILSPVSSLTPENKSTSGGILSAIEEANVGGGGAGDVNGNAETEGTAQAQVRDEKLVRMGMMTALAIGIHNFPEGLATFVATLADPAVGAALAVAIAIHNIPEGLCVAIPVYYATGNRWKAFGWAFVSGLSEPIGAGLGWLILKDVMSELVYGILFGMVAGMMINISLQELIPTAVRYDPTDKVTTNSIIVGMAIMAASLALFMY